MEKLFFPHPEHTMYSHTALGMVSHSSSDLSYLKPFHTHTHARKKKPPSPNASKEEEAPIRPPIEFLPIGDWKKGGLEGASANAKKRKSVEWKETGPGAATDLMALTKE